jgi:hypothetical protein
MILRTMLLAASLFAGPAFAEDPPDADTLLRPQATTSVQHPFQLQRLQAPPPPCIGPLKLGAPPCRFVSTLGTRAAVVALQLLRPVDARLVRASTISPTAPGKPVLASGAPTKPGLLFSGYTADPVFVGLGQFDMRARDTP